MIFRVIKYDMDQVSITHGLLSNAAQSSFVLSRYDIIFITNTTNCIMKYIR